LIVQDLPLLPSDRVYQLWLLRDSTRDNGGIFQVDAQGFGMLLIHAPHPLADYRAAGITEEPAGGSSGPTSPRLIGGRLQALEYTTP
jgi:anti-sigma-K factor RskA